MIAPAVLNQLLRNVRHRMGDHGIGTILGMEKNVTTYNLERMNMTLHGVKDTEFEIRHGDTRENNGSPENNGSWFKSMDSE